MADSSSKKEMMMRFSDFSGDQAWMGAMLETASRMVWRLSGAKMSRELRLVMISVLDGGVGWTSGGMLERSSDSDALEERVDARDGGEGFVS